MSPQAPQKTDTGQKHHAHTKARPDWKRSRDKHRYQAKALMNALMAAAVQNRPEARSIARHARKLRLINTSTVLASSCEICELKSLTSSLGKGKDKGKGNDKKDSSTQSRIDLIKKRKELMDLYNDLVDYYEGLGAALIERYPDLDSDSRPRLARKRLEMCEACALKGWDGVDV